MTIDARHTLFSGFIASRVDYCNAVLYGVSAKVTRWLQMVLNAAARLVVGTGKYDHITPALRDVPHWLPVPPRTEFNFKIAVLAFDCVRGWPCLLQRCLRAGVGYCCSDLSQFG